MKMQRYESVAADSLMGLNRLLRQGWHPVREISGPAGTVLTLLEKESDFPPFPGAVLMDGVPVEFLADVMLFENFSMDEIRQVVGKCELVTHRKSDVIFSQGDAADAVFVVVSGEIEIVLPGLPDAETSVAVLQPGGVFGESTFFSESPHTMSARCGSDSATLLALGRISCDELLQSGSAAALKLLHNSARILAGRLQETDQWVRTLLTESQMSQISASWRRFRHRVSGTDHVGGGFFGI